MKTALRSVRAARYVMPFREGGSVPALVEGDDLGLYVVKLRGASQGPKALIAELVGGELARALGLPVPELVFLDLDRAISESEIDPEIRAPLEASVGANLALDFLPGSLTFDPIGKRPPDASLASRIVLFDAFVANVDRTPKNPNLLVWHKALWLIDHGACLYFHHGWSPSDVLADAADPFAEVENHVLLRWASDLEAAADDLRLRLTPEVIASVVASIPAAWLDADRSWEDEGAQRAAYVAWLSARRDRLPVLVEEASRARSRRI